MDNTFDKLTRYYDSSPTADSSHIYSAAWSADYEVGNLVESLREDTLSLIDSLQRVIIHLDENASEGREPNVCINGLGEIQSRGTRIDNTIGKLEMAVKSRRALGSLLDKLAGTPTTEEVLEEIDGMLRG